MEKGGFVYMMASGRNGTLYIGVTSDLIKRVYEHKNNIFDGFTKKYGIKNLVYFEVFEEIEEAIKREKVLKGWKRERKIALFEPQNKEWSDLYDSLLK